MKSRSMTVLLESEKHKKEQHWNMEYLLTLIADKKFSISSVLA